MVEVAKRFGVPTHSLYAWIKQYGKSEQHSLSCVQALTSSRRSPKRLLRLETQCLQHACHHEDQRLLALMKVLWLESG